MNIGETRVLAAVGIRNDGAKQIFGVIEGGSEHHLVANALLADLIGRSLTADKDKIYLSAAVI